MGGREVLQRRVAIAALATALLAVGMAGSALASAGCDAVNAAGFNFSVAAGGNGQRVVSGFAVGEKVTFNVTRTAIVSDGGGFTLQNAVSGQLYNSPDYKAALETKVYTITGTNDFSLTAQLDSLDAAMSLTATCTAVTATPAAPATPTGPTDSQKLRTVQTQGTQIVAQNSGGAIADSVDRAIADGLGGNGSGGTVTDGGNNGPAGLGGPMPSFLGRPQQDAAPEPDSAAFSVNRRDWNAWGNMRATESARHPQAGGFQGSQVNGTFGVGHRVMPGLVVGAFGGFERFGYDIRSLTGKLSGDGLTGGAYLGWRIVPGIRFDFAGAYSAIEYDARAATASGSFTGQRRLVSTGLTGGHAIGGVVLEPSARVFAIWENQGAWTDSLAVRQAQNRFSLGRASAGLRAAYPVTVGNGLTLAPYAGIYGDYYFSSGEAPTPGTEILAISDGWSARAISGLSIDLGGAAVSVGGEWGGIGADHTQRSLTVRGALPF